MSLNRFQGIGNLGKDPETRELPNGGMVTNFSVGITEKYTDKSGEKKELTEWVNIATFGKLAEIAAKWLKKGQSVYVEGKLKTEKYEKNGETKYSTKIVASSFEMLGGKRTESPDDKAKRVRDNQTDEFDDSIPF